ncbi:DUF3465 domain-containing protein [Thalassotalea piscium]|uniref:DUF3465 domain-containing protein n=1 Tax=Thalassotalea piscium TaxID=1230533 RepID=A0A7X0NIJ4_9GAMM|nr:DUF3465 domain-containing protein [Thalassotalea piscium]MBB6544040.1 hypothetical protein [Thalassotalea piscium]
MKAIGIVHKILPDDLKGSRHQRFIVKLKDNQTVLIIHNIDISRKIHDLRIGDKVEFSGEYQWNSAGGMVHWTHKDPHSKQKGGWIKHKDRLYN